MIGNASSIDPKVLTSARQWSRIVIDVLDNNTLYIGSSRESLLSSGIGVVGGTPIDKNHPYREWIFGDLWYIGSVDGMVFNYEIYPSVQRLP